MLRSVVTTVLSTLDRIFATSFTAAASGSDATTTQEAPTMTLITCANCKSDFECSVEDDFADSLDADGNSMCPACWLAKTPRPAWSMQCPYCSNEAIKFATTDDGDAVCMSCYNEWASESPTGQVFDDVCCPCDWNDASNCPDHNPKETALTERIPNANPLSKLAQVWQAFLAVRDNLDLDADPIRKANGLYLPNDIQRTANRFQMALMDTAPVTCRYIACSYGNPNHGDGYCTAHNNFCDSAFSATMALIHGPTKYVDCADHDGLDCMGYPA